MIQVVICSQIPAMRAGLRALLAGDDELSIRAVISSFASLPEGLEEGGILVVTSGILDEDSLKDLDGIERSGSWGILLVGEEMVEARTLLGRRAWGWMSPDASPEALQAAVRAINEGLVVVSSELMAGLVEPETEPGSLSLLRGLQGQSPGEEPPETLTGREIDVLRLAAQGLTNKQIAHALGISEHTVKFHVSAIFSKLEVSNRAEAVRKGARWGWVPL